LRLARHRADLVAEVTNIGDPSLGVDECLAAVEERTLVHEALQRVPLHLRTVLMLHEMDGFIIPDVAAALGIAVNTAYSRLRLGRESFRASMTRLLRRRDGR
jgi:RNA polymerase sigma-70 factor (ECF subfamily)